MGKLPEGLLSHKVLAGPDLEDAFQLPDRSIFRASRQDRRRGVGGIGLVRPLEESRPPDPCVTARDGRKGALKQRHPFFAIIVRNAGKIDY